MWQQGVRWGGADAAGRLMAQQMAAAAAATTLEVLVLHFHQHKLLESLPAGK